MQLIFGREVAEQLQNRYTILELETFTLEDKLLEVFCVVPAEKIALTEITTVEHSTKLHNDFLAALRQEDYKICQDLSVHLIGRFGGEVDSFYNTILDRISSLAAK